jgi:predicted GNAT family acetyltransferase
MASFGSSLSRIVTRLYSVSSRPVQHLPGKSRFEMTFPDGGPSLVPFPHSSPLPPQSESNTCWIYCNVDVAFLNYTKQGNEIQLNETLVPPNKRGQGIGDELGKV